MAGTATARSQLQAADLRHITLDEGSDGFHRSWIMLLPQGQFEHPEYGTLDFSRHILSEIKRNFDAGVRGIEIALDYDHRAPQNNDTRAPGWIERLELGESVNKPAGLWAYVRWTRIGLSDVQEQIYRYISAEYRPEYRNDMTGETFSHVLVGATLTNRPFMKVMPAIELAEVSHRAWSDVDKSKLPASCFLVVGDRSKKSTWQLPIYEGAGPMKDGMYTKRGPLNLNGVRAALAAIGGAHTGKPMDVPSSLRGRLERLLNKYGGKDDMAKRKMAEPDEEREEFAAQEDDPEELADMETRMRDMHDPDDDGDDDTTPGGDTDHDTLAEDSEDDEPEVDAKSDRHGRMTTDGHTHGRFGRHSHDGDANHAEAPLKRGRRLAEPSESDQTALLAERVRHLEMQLHEKNVDMRLAEWSGQSFELSEKTADGKTIKRGGKVALSKAFRDKYREFALTEGFQMGEARFARVNQLIELLLSDGLVDLSVRSLGSFEQEERNVRALVESGDEEAASRQLAERAREIALAEHKRPLRELDGETVASIQRRAAQELGYQKRRAAR